MMSSSSAIVAAAPPAPPPLTAKEAVRQAEAEGLTLLRSDNSTGFKGVGFSSSRKSKPYQAQMKRGGKSVSFGSYATAEEAALCYARSLPAQAAAAAPPAPPPLTAEEALRQAQAEGLTLLRSDNSTGYKGVAFNSNTKGKPYQAKVRRGGKTVHLGYFTTAEEAALSIARTPEARAAAAAPPEPPPMTAEEALPQAQAAAAPPEPPPMTAEEALRQAEAEGLTLLKSESSCTGYKGVAFLSGARSKPYQAQMKRGGKSVSFGSYATAEEAALCYARTPEGRAAAAAPPAPPPLTAEEALRQAEAEGLTLLRSASVSPRASCTGYKGVYLDSSQNLTKPYKAQMQRGGKEVYVGRFVTREEAALVVARASAAQAAAPQLPAASSRKRRKVKSEEQPPDVSADVVDVVILEGRFIVESTTFE